MSPTEIEIDHTHLYPGARGRLRGTLPGAEGPALVHFADGVTAEARLAGGELHVAAYRTRAGTRIPARAWRLQRDGDGGLRVEARLS